MNLSFNFDEFFPNFKNFLCFLFLFGVRVGFSSLTFSSKYLRFDGEIFL